MFQSCHWMWWLQHVFSGEVNASTTLCSWRLWRGDCVDDRSVVSGSGFVILVLPLKKLEWWSWMNHQWTMKRWKRWYDWYDVSDGLKCRPSRPVEGGVSTPQPRESNSWCCLPARLSTKRMCHVCLVNMRCVRCVRWDDVDTLKVGIGTATALVKNKADENHKIKKDTVYISIHQYTQYTVIKSHLWFALWSPGSPLALHFKLPVFVETYLKSCLAHFGTDWRQNSWIGICPLLESITRRRVPDQKERRAVPQRWDRSKTRLLQRRMRSAAIHGASIGFYKRAKTRFSRYSYRIDMHWCTVPMAVSVISSAMHFSGGLRSQSRGQLASFTVILVHPQLFKSF